MAQWKNVCPACARPWVQFPSIDKHRPKKKKMMRRMSVVDKMVEGLKRAKVKSLTHSQVTVVQQGPEENPLTSLQHLKDAIRKHTTGDSESQVGDVLLIDKFFFFYSYVHTMFGSFPPPSPCPIPCLSQPLPLPPPPSRYLAETILPLSLILLKRAYNQ
jgi:hypothetical protein